MESFLRNINRTQKNIATPRIKNKFKVDDFFFFLVCRCTHYIIFYNCGIILTSEYIYFCPLRSYQNSAFGSSIIQIFVSICFLLVLIIFQDTGCMHYKRSFLSFIQKHLSLTHTHVSYILCYNT